MAAISDQLTLAASEQFVNRGRDLITELAQLRDRMETYAAIFEERGGQSRFTSQKHEGQDLTPEQLAENERLDELGIIALDIVVLRNDLAAFLDAGKLAKLNRLRADYT
jgi:hypothetical protein